MSSNSHCSLRTSFINRNIDDILDEGLEDIRETLYQGAAFVKEPSLFTYSDYGVSAILSPGANKTKELDDLLYVKIISPNSRGTYIPRHGRIFLKKGSWCRPTLVHETLHSVSIFAADQNIQIGDRYLFLREGLTQFLTGYILWRKYRQCFDSWKDKIYPQWCALEAYENMTRVWYTFCRFVDFEEVKKLYFGNGSFDWSRAWSGFIRFINEAGYEFKDPLPVREASLQNRFIKQCRKAFGKYKFNKMFEIESSDLDYGLIVSC